MLNVTNSYLVGSFEQKVDYRVVKMGIFKPNTNTFFTNVANAVYDIQYRKNLSASLSGVVDTKLIARKIIDGSGGSSLITFVQSRVKELFNNILGDHDYITDFLTFIAGSRSEIRLNVENCTFDMVVDFIMNHSSIKVPAELVSVVAMILYDLAFELGANVNTRPYVMLYSPMLSTNITKRNIEEIMMVTMIEEYLADNVKLKLSEVKTRMGGFIGKQGLAGIVSEHYRTVGTILFTKIASQSKLDEIYWRLRVYLTQNYEQDASTEEYEMICSSPSIIEMANNITLQKNALSSQSKPSLSNIILWHSLDETFNRYLNKIEDISSKKFNELMNEVNLDFIKDQFGYKRVALLTRSPMNLMNNVAYYQFSRNHSTDTMTVAEAKEVESLCKALDNVTSILSVFDVEKMFKSLLGDIVNYSSKIGGIITIGEITYAHKMAIALSNFVASTIIDKTSGSPTSKFYFMVTPKTELDRKIIFDDLGVESFYSDDLNTAVFFSNPITTSRKSLEQKNFVVPLSDKVVYLHDIQSGLDFTTKVTLDIDLNGQTISIEFSMTDALFQEISNDIFFPILPSHVTRWISILENLLDLIKILEGEFTNNHFKTIILGLIQPAVEENTAATNSLGQPIHIDDRLKTFIKESRVISKFKTHVLGEVINMMIEFRNITFVRHISEVILRKMHENDTVRSMFKTINHLKASEMIKMILLENAPKLFLSLVESPLQTTQIHDLFNEIITRCKNNENKDIYTALLENSLRRF